MSSHVQRHALHQAKPLYLVGAWHVFDAHEVGGTSHHHQELGGHYYDNHGRSARQHHAHALRRGGVVCFLRCSHLPGRAIQEGTACVGCTDVLRHPRVGATRHITHAENHCTVGQASSLSDPSWFVGGNAARINVWTNFVSGHVREANVSKVFHLLQHFRLVFGTLFLSVDRLWASPMSFHPCPVLLLLLVTAVSAARRRSLLHPVSLWCVFSLHKRCRQMRG